VLCNSSTITIINLNDLIFINKLNQQEQTSLYFSEETADYYFHTCFEDYSLCQHKLNQVNVVAAKMGMEFDDTQSEPLLTVMERALKVKRKIQHDIKSVGKVTFNYGHGPVHVTEYGMILKTIAFMTSKHVVVKALINMRRASPSAKPQQEAGFAAKGKEPLVEYLL